MREQGRVAVVAGCLLISSSVTVLADGGRAAAGDLDPEFGVGGVALAHFAHEDGRGMAIQPNGKIVVAGSAITGGINDNFALTRFNKIGTLDTGFGAGGLVETDLGSTTEYGRAIALQNDRKIVVAGPAIFSSRDFAVVRYTSDGGVDGSFAGGVVTTNIGNASDDQPWAIAIQSDGRIVVAGSTNAAGTQDIAVVRYKTNGQLDPSFGAGGIAITDINGGSETAFGVATQSGGKVVVAGFACNDASCSDTDFVVIRYEIDGDLDPTFNGTGFATTAVGVDDEAAYAIAVQSDDKIVAAGYTCTDGTCTDKNFAVVRYLNNGDPDPTFGIGGSVTTNIAGIHEEAYGVAVSPGGAVVVAGITTISNKYDVGVVCYTSAGVPDSNFGTNGVAIAAFNNDNDYARAVAIQPDGKIVVGGHAYNLANPGHDFAVARFFGVEMFFDGFESGDMSAWSAVVP